jgi:uncharacterized protein
MTEIFDLMPKALRITAPLVPYITIVFGLFIAENAWAAILGYHLGMIIIICLTGNKVPIGLIITSKSRIIPILTALVGMCGGVSILFLWHIGIFTIDVSNYLALIGLNNSKSFAVFIIYFCIVNPWLEEYYWRGYLKGGSSKPEVNDIFFSGYHIVVLYQLVESIWLIGVFFALIAAAWLWRQANSKSRGLFPSVISHLFADASVMVVVCLNIF